jgi:predicted nucleic acid-binding protein
VEKGNHQLVDVRDLLIAPTAERHGATVLHYDGDFDMTPTITGQPTARVAPAGHRLITPLAATGR